MNGTCSTGPGNPASAGRARRQSQRLSCRAVSAPWGWGVGGRSPSSELTKQDTGKPGLPRHNSPPLGSFLPTPRSDTGHLEASPTARWCPSFVTSLGHHIIYMAPSCLASLLTPSSSSICSLRVSVSRVGISCNISNRFIIFVRAICDE